ncbi:MAG: assimilatory sulfite reductase (NADPH) flavoprotein subunit, partial [Gammaproteobacteria bacterium]|nr:assimilatory sulfite reductase (NADPH) flavoprotein subunit [Gammaproteobacteria bacterium]
LFIVVSTHGEGDPPDDAEELYEYLFSNRAPKLAGLQFSVLALGDSSYEHFCETGRRFDERLTALGAHRLSELTACDVDYQQPADEWIGRTVAGAVDTLKSEKLEPLKPSLQVVPAASVYDKTNPFPAELLVNQKITGRDSEKDVRHIEFSLAESGLHYQPGDSLGVLPVNPRPVVTAILDALKLNGDAAVISGDEEKPLYDALVSDLEITVLSRSFIEQYAALTEADELQQLLQPDKRKALGGYMKTRQIIDVIKDYPAKLEPQAFTACLRELTPRLYSIASSLNACLDEVHLTVSAVRYESFGFTHYGAASTYLADGITAGQTANVFVEPNDRFRLPQDPHTPVIMIGPGTGVAPYRAFLQEREAAGAAGKNWLFFGAQHFSSDFLYQLEWLRYLKNGLLTRMDVAFSRDKENKIYVQHRMLEQSRRFYAWLEEGAYVYVCGDSKQMAPDVNLALIEIIKREAGVTTDRAEEYLRNLKRSGRYLRDVY